MFSSDKRPGKDDKEPVTMASRVLSFCFAVFLSVILLYWPSTSSPPSGDGCF